MNENDMAQYIEFRSRIYTIKQINSVVLNKYTVFLHSLKENFLVDNEMIYSRDFQNNLKRLEGIQNSLNGLISIINGMM